MARRIPALTVNYVGLVLLEFVVQPVLFLANGQHLRPSWGGLAVLALLLIGVGRGSSLAWACLLVWTLVLTALVLPFALSSLSALALVAYSAATLALLISRPIRSHVRRQNVTLGPAQRPSRL